MSPFLLVGLLAFIYTLNLPFGYWRAGTKRFTRGWIAAIHLPVPLVFAVRVLAGVGLELIPLFLLAFFLGQATGASFKPRIAPRILRRASNCLVMDLYRAFRG